MQVIFLLSFLDKDSKTNTRTNTDTKKARQQDLLYCNHSFFSDRDSSQSLARTPRGPVPTFDLIKALFLTLFLIHYIVIWWYDNKYWCNKLKHNYFLFQDDEMKGCYMKEGNNVFGPLDQPLFQITLRESLFTVLNCISSSSGNNGFYQTLLQAMDRLEGNEKYTKVQIFLNRIFPWKSIAPRIYSGEKSLRLQQFLLTWPIRTPESWIAFHMKENSRQLF